MSWQRRGDSADETQRAGELLAQVLRAGDIVILEGQLGAGKTTFTQGVARGLGVTERVTSPTFTVVRQHRCRGVGGIVTLHHADIYRVEQLGEVLELALGELVEESAVAVVEWGELAGDLFGPETLHVKLTINEAESRTITVDGAVAEHRQDQLSLWERA